MTKIFSVLAAAVVLTLSMSAFQPSQARSTVAQQERSYSEGLNGGQ